MLSLVKDQVNLWWIQGTVLGLAFLSNIALCVGQSVGPLVGKIVETLKEKGFCEFDLI